MKKSKTLKNFLSIILTCTTLIQITPVSCEVPQSKNKKYTAILGTVAGICGATAAFLSIGMANQSSKLHEKQNEVNELDKKINDLQLKLKLLEKAKQESEQTNKQKTEILESKLNTAEAANDKLQQTWYITYYCATLGMINQRNDWVAIVVKCADLYKTDLNMRKDIDEMIKYTDKRNVSKFDFILNLLTATYLSKYLPLGALGTEIPTEFAPGHWLCCCNIKTTGDTSLDNQTFETCKKLAINIFTDALKHLDPNDIEEAHLRTMLQTEFIDVLKSV